MKRTWRVGLCGEENAFTFLSCFYVEEAVTFLIVSLAGKIQLFQAVKVGSCWLCPSQLDSWKTFLWLLRKLRVIIPFPPHWHLPIPLFPNSLTLSINWWGNALSSTSRKLNWPVLVWKKEKEGRRRRKRQTDTTKKEGEEMEVKCHGGEKICHCVVLST